MVSSIGQAAFATPTAAPGMMFPNKPDLASSSGVSGASTESYGRYDPTPTHHYRYQPGSKRIHKFAKGNILGPAGTWGQQHLTKFNIRKQVGGAAGYLSQHPMTRLKKTQMVAAYMGRGGSLPNLPRGGNVMSVVDSGGTPEPPYDIEERVGIGNQNLTGRRTLPGIQTGTQTEAGDYNERAGGNGNGVGSTTDLSDDPTFIGWGESEDGENAPTIASQLRSALDEFEANKASSRQSTPSSRRSSMSVDEVRIIHQGVQASLGDSDNLRKEVKKLQNSREIDATYLQGALQKVSQQGVEIQELLQLLSQVTAENQQLQQIINQDKQQLEQSLVLLNQNQQIIESLAGREGMDIDKVGTSNSSGIDLSDTSTDSSWERRKGDKGEGKYATAKTVFNNLKAKMNELGRKQGAVLNIHYDDRTIATSLAVVVDSMSDRRVATLLNRLNAFIQSDNEDISELQTIIDGIINIAKIMRRDKKGKSSKRQLESGRNLK